MNKELKEIYIQDQKDRDKLESTTISWEVVNQNDSNRRNRVMKLYEKGEVRTDLDYYYAAMIFQHGLKTHDYEFANQLCQTAMKMGNTKAKWLYAATYDRILTSKKAKYQKFGTQFRKDSADSPWYLYPVDPKTTDAERAKYNVPTIAEQNIKVIEMNAQN